MQYKDLVNEVFVTPVRSATIIDDEYPNLDDLISGKVTRNSVDDSFVGDAAITYERPNKVKKRIDELRSKALVVDVRNDVPDLGASVGYHHSDLVVLDYQLEGPQGDGSKSKKIARELLVNNDHFNLVILHTQARLEDAFSDIVLSLLVKPEGFQEALIERGEELLDEIGVAPLDVFGASQYLLFRRKGCAKFRRMIYNSTTRAEEDLLSDLDRTITFHSLEGRDIWALVVACISSFEKGRGFGEEKVAGLVWSTQEPFWIKSDRGFIAFTRKGTSDTLWETLLNALDDWGPTPSRLISGKIRNVLHRQGSQIEGQMLEDAHIGALSFRRYISESKEDVRSSLITSEIGRQFEFYRGSCEEPIIKFSEKLLTSESEERSGSSKYPVDLENDRELMKAHDKLNFHVSCKASSGTHLTTGHILTQGNDVWIVVSPACDLVPGQKNNRAKGFVQFAAAKMEKLNDIAKCREYSHTGNYLFIPVDGEVKAFSVYPSSGEGGAADRHLLYSYFFAAQDGQYNANNSITVYRENCADDGQLVFEEQTFSRHEMQLRYEYALNLLSKVGVHASRVGLDFVSPKE